MPDSWTAPDFVRELPEHIARLTWPPNRLQAERDRRLQALVRIAREKSPWHAERLRRIDPEKITEARLGDLPVMTKGEAMDGFDRVVTDPRLRFSDVLAHFEEHGAELPLLGQYRAVISSGWSGRTGLFPYDVAAWRTLQCINVRMSARDRMIHHEALRQRPVVAVVAAATPTHMSAAIVGGLGTGLADIHRFPVTLPFSEIVKGVAAVRPDTLSGYPSMIAHIARAQLEGRLSISPSRIVTSAESLLPEYREAMELTWPSARIANVWALSESGTAAAGCFHGEGMHLADDAVIIEPVDGAGNPVPVGEQSEKLLLTVLFNPLFPLIRYEITDRIVTLAEPCPCGVTHRRIGDLVERFDEVFEYPPHVKVHPAVFRAELSHEAAMREYQIRQTDRGVQVSLVVEGEFSGERLRHGLARRLHELGLPDPEVEVEIVPELGRLSSGKLKRYVPKPSTSASG